MCDGVPGVGWEGEPAERTRGGTVDSSMKKKLQLSKIPLIHKNDILELKNKHGVLNSKKDEDVT